MKSVVVRCVNGWIASSLTSSLGTSGGYRRLNKDELLMRLDEWWLLRTSSVQLVGEFLGAVLWGAMRLAGCQAEYIHGYRHR